MTRELRVTLCCASLLGIGPSGLAQEMQADAAEVELAEQPPSPELTLELLLTASTLTSDLALPADVPLTRTYRTALQPDERAAFLQASERALALLERSLAGPFERWDELEHGHSLPRRDAEATPGHLALVRAQMLLDAGAHNAALTHVEMAVALLQRLDHDVNPRNLRTCQRLQHHVLLVLACGVDAWNGARAERVSVVLNDLGSGVDRVQRAAKWTVREAKFVQTATPDALVQAGYGAGVWELRMQGTLQQVAEAYATLARAFSGEPEAIMPALREVETLLESDDIVRLEPFKKLVERQWRELMAQARITALRCELRLRQEPDANVTELGRGASLPIDRELEEDRVVWRINPPDEANIPATRADRFVVLPLSE